MGTAKIVIKCLLVMSFLLFSLTINAETGILTNQSEYLTASTLINCIEKGNADKLLNKIYNDQAAWYNLLDKIATGDPEWLKVAKGLARAADAGASEQLDAAVGEALYDAPDKVLENSLSVFSLDAICGAPDIDDTRFGSYKLANDEIDRRKAALEQLVNPELVDDIQGCMKRLEESRKDIARFYGVGK